MRIVLFGAGGHIAQRIAREALERGHEVIGVVRNPDKFKSYDDRMQVVQADATDAASVANVAKGADAIVVAVSPRPSPTGLPASSLTAAARAVIEGAKKAGVRRLIVVGGAGSLEVAPGKRVVDQPGFPAEHKSEALAQADALDVYRKEANGLDWTYISPAGMVAPGERTAKYRTGGDQLLTDASGKSFLTFEDYAVALIDELENGKHLARRMTVAY